MRPNRRLFVLVMLTLMASVSFAIPTHLMAGTPSRPTAVAIVDIPSIAGRWSGILYGRPGGARGRDWVEVALHADGTYTLASARMIGVFNRSGTFRLADGKLVSEGENTRLVLTFVPGGGKRFLRAESTMASGQSLQADLYPAP